MFAKYVSNTNTTQAQVMSDLALLISGSPLSALSASCDKANSQLISTIAPGWSIVDTLAANAGIVLAASDANGLTTKNVKLYPSNASNFDIVGYESWNATTHVGVSPTTATGIILPYSTPAILTYWIFATPRSLMIMSSGTVGIGAIEFSRDAAYLVGSTYPCFVTTALHSLCGVSGASMSVSRQKNMIAAGDVNGQAVNSATIANRNAAAVGVLTAPSQTTFDGSGNIYYETRPIWVANGNMSTNAMGILGKLFDVLEVNRTVGAPLDTFFDGTDTWMIFMSLSNSGLMLFKMA
jgi:hypothetical protein